MKFFTQLPRIQAPGLLPAVLVSFFAFAPPLAAQQECLPPGLGQSSSRNIFTERQEMDIGDAVAEQMKQ
jgi:hypothetical protein